MKQMPLGNVRLNSIEGVISIMGFQLLTAMLRLTAMTTIHKMSSPCYVVCVTEKVLMMSVQMSDDWSKAPHTKMSPGTLIVTRSSPLSAQ